MKFFFLILTGTLVFFFNHCVNAQDTDERTIIVTPSNTTLTPSTMTPTPVSTVTTTTTLERPVITTPAPPPKETIVTPSGYAYCFTIKSGWYRDVWVPDHRVCQYENTPGKVAWVEGYWGCTKYDLPKGICTNWQWYPGHWEQTLVVF